MTKYFDINASGHSIRCKLYCNDMRSIRKIVLFGHGFGGHKDNKAAERFALTVLSKYKNAAVLTFNWPCHGDDVKKKLSLEDCSIYISLIVDYLKERFAPSNLYVYATSFGGYLFLKYIAENGNPFDKIALRCPAINMYESLTGRIMSSGDVEKLEKEKSIQVGFDRKVTITSAFLAELQRKDITQYDYLDYCEQIEILHGTKDEIIPFDVVRDFADNNLIEFIPIEKADHRFQDPAIMGNAIKRILDFLQM